MVVSVSLGEMCEKSDERQNPLTWLFQAIMEAMQ